MNPIEPRFCSGCGAAWTVGSRFCSGCGAPPAGAPAAEPPADAAPPAKPSSTGAGDALAWQIDVSVLGNRFMRNSLLKGCLVAAGVSAVFMGAIFGLSSGEAVVALETAGLAVAGITVLFGVGLVGFLVIVGFHQPIAYRLDGEGATMFNISRAAQAVHRTAIVAGLLAGNMSVVASGAAARSRETRCCSWADARSVEDYPAERTLVVRGGVLSTVDIFCAPENYIQVRDFILVRTPQATRR